MNRTRRIALPGWSTGEGSWGATKPYLEFLSKFGQVELVTPREGLVPDIDLLVLPGGMDMDAFCYNEVPSFFSGNIDKDKHYFYKQNLKLYIEAGVPIFGICLGMQALNVAFDGKLMQHGHFPYTERPERKELLKFTLPEEDKDLLSNPHAYKVNSMHHQAVTLATLSNELISLATSEFNNVEVLKHKTLPIYGVQYHPEEIYDELSINIIRKLLK